MEQRFNAARAALAKQASVDPQRIGAIGYCFGGAVVINMARAGADLSAVAGFHASVGLNTPAPAPGAVKAKILVMNIPAISAATARSCDGYAIAPSSISGPMSWETMMSEQEVITKDNATVTVDGVAFFQVFDAAKASYEVANLCARP
jgi:regulator of protease activity HflC (stomatin/prohibitin superfamily)